MRISLPHTIDNGHGQIMTFRELVHEPDGDKLIATGTCTPNAGPTMHVHYKQDEGFKIVKGKIGCQFYGEEPVYYTEGQEVVFPRNIPHRFWNAGNDILELKSWVKPANSITFFLPTLYAAQKKTRTGRPELFDAAYLMVRYKNEYKSLGLPLFVRKIVLPLVYSLGNILGKYKKFKDAPDPLK
jgi:mannose-6-phosphate isomerase-like protein (cupin superfamily)